MDGRRGRPVRSQLGRQEVVMFTSKTKVLLILTQDVLDYGGGGRGLTFPDVPQPRGEIR